ATEPWLKTLETRSPGSTVVPDGWLSNRSSAATSDNPLTKTTADPAGTLTELRSGLDVAASTPSTPQLPLKVTVGVAAAAGAAGSTAIAATTAPPRVRPSRCRYASGILHSHVVKGTDASRPEQRRATYPVTRTPILPRC